MENLTIIDHPFVQDSLMHLRRKETEIQQFRHHSDKLCQLLFYEAVRGLTLEEFFGGKSGVYAGYAPAADSNNPQGYASAVAGWLGIDPNTPLGSLQAQTSPSESSVGTSTIDSWDLGGSEVAGLSPVAWLGLGIAGIGLLWAATS